MKRTIKKQFWFSKEETQLLQKKAKKACLSEAGLVRLLIKGYEPKEKPGEEFYAAMRELSSIGNSLNQLAAKANTLGFIDAPLLKQQVAKWTQFQNKIENTFLRPAESGIKWQ